MNAFPPMPTTYRLSSPRSFPASAPWMLPDGPTACDVGNRALRAGFLDPARSIYEALISREPLHPEISFALAETELAAGRWDRSQAILDLMPPDFRQCPAVLALGADLDLARGRIGSALRQAFLATELSPASARARFLSARMHWLGGSHHEAELGFLSLVGEPEGGDRAAAWAVFSGWRQGHIREVGELFASLRTDDAVCEGLRQFGHERLGLEWAPSDRVHHGVRSESARHWSDLFREVPGPGVRPGVAVARLR